MNKPLKIALDLDGVLACFADAWRNIVLEVCQEDNIPLDKVREYPVNYDLGSMLLMSPDDAAKVVKRAWEKIEATTNFWLELEPYQDSGFSSVHVDDIFYVTSRKLTKGMTVRLQTDRWLEDHLFRYGSVIPVPRANDKVELIQLLDIDYLLDDRFDTIRMLNQRAKGKGFLLDRPWNQKPVSIAHDEPRVSTVQEFIDLVTI